MICGISEKQILKEIDEKEKEVIKIAKECNADEIRIEAMR